MVPDIFGRKKMLFIRFEKKNQTAIKFLFFNSNPLFTNDSIKVLENLFHSLIFIDPCPPLLIKITKVRTLHGFYFDNINHFYG